MLVALCLLLWLIDKEASSMTNQILLYVQVDRECKALENPKVFNRQSAGIRKALRQYLMDSWLALKIT